LYGKQAWGSASVGLDFGKLVLKMDTKLDEYAGGSFAIKAIFELREIERVDTGYLNNSVFIHSNPISTLF
jgi:hypothetical protein